MENGGCAWLSFKNRLHMTATPTAKAGGKHHEEVLQGFAYAHTARMQGKDLRGIRHTKAYKELLVGFYYISPVAYRAARTSGFTHL